MVPVSYRWKIREHDRDLVARIMAETGYDELFSGLLAGRGLRSKAEIDRFLNSTADDMYDPFLYKGMDQAAERIMKAISGDEKITIYGDYDVDGITATSILILYMRSLGLDPAYYLPDRMSEGYGLNENAIRKISSDGTKLIITVDTGISAVKECALVKELGMDIIVTDHHECQNQLPDAAAVIDAKQADETYPYRNLAGCGVAYKLVQAIDKSLENRSDIKCCPAGADELKKYLELAAVGTIADIVPLDDENRIIVREGFARMKSPSNYGLYCLMKNAGYDFMRKLTAGFIGFTIAPRLNAGGRMGDAARGVELFTTADKSYAERLAELLSRENDIRKETEKEILDAVTEKIENDNSLKNSRIIVAAGEGWHHGVIGIVSSRVKDHYYRPNILLCIEGDTAVGSARSVPGFDLFKALMACKDLMIKFGGHAAAAGMTLKTKDIPELQRRLNEYAASVMDRDILVPDLVSEVEMTPSELTVDFIEKLQRLEPYGQGMPEPVIRIDGLLQEVSRIGADRETVRLNLMDNRADLKIISFRNGVLASFLKPDMMVSAAGTASINEFRQNRNPQLILKDIRVMSKDDEDMYAMMNSFSLRMVTDDFCRFLDEQNIGRLLRAEGISGKDACVISFNYLKSRISCSLSEGFINLAIDFGGNEKHLPLVLFMVSCMVFEELGLVEIEQSGPYMRYQLIKGKKTRLADSMIYTKYLDM